jgi:hypothetical protein
MARILAHRGGALGAPENTIAAFRRAFSEGAHGAECDVRVTADGEFVLFHDENAKRLTGFGRPVSSMKWKDLSKLRVLGGGPVAHLDDLLNLLAPRKDKTCYFELCFDDPVLAGRLYYRLKDSGFAGRLYALVFAHRKGLLDGVKRICPELGAAVMPLLPWDISRTALSAGADAVCAGWIDRPWARGLFKASAFAFDLADQLEIASELGLKLSGGIANTPDDVRWLMDRGFDSIWTDDVPMALRAAYDAGISVLGEDDRS